MGMKEKYKKIAKNILTEIFEHYTKSSNDLSYQLVIDDKSSNFLLISDGWIDESRFYGILIHIQIKDDGRLWLHDDNTDLIVVDRLLEKGIPKKDIVIGWHSPSMRPDTEFAIV